MIISYSQCDSLASAIKKTFDGEHPCKMCKIIKKGRKAEQEKTATVKVEMKSELFLQTQSLMVYPPQFLRDNARISSDGSPRLDPPLLRPPIFA